MKQQQPTMQIPNTLYGLLSEFGYQFCLAEQTLVYCHWSAVIAMKQWKAADTAGITMPLWFNASSITETKAIRFLITWSLASLSEKTLKRKRYISLFDGMLDTGSSVEACLYFSLYNVEEAPRNSRMVGGLGDEVIEFHIVGHAIYKCWFVSTFILPIHSSRGRRDTASIM